LYFFICRETAANKNRHAFGKYNTILTCPKGLVVFPGRRLPAREKDKILCDLPALLNSLRVKLHYILM
jgi:hypothetical protein